MNKQLMEILIEINKLPGNKIRILCRKFRTSEDSQKYCYGIKCYNCILNNEPSFYTREILLLVRYIDE